LPLRITVVIYNFNVLDTKQFSVAKVALIGNVTLFDRSHILTF